MNLNKSREHGYRRIQVLLNHKIIIWCIHITCKRLMWNFVCKCSLSIRTIYLALIMRPLPRKTWLKLFPSMTPTQEVKLHYSNVVRHPYVNQVLLRSPIFMEWHTMHTRKNKISMSTIENQFYIICFYIYFEPPT